MAGHGSGDVQADGPGPGGLGSGRPAPDGQATAGSGPGESGPGGGGPGMAAPGERQAGVPARLLRSWDAAEAQLFPLIMARPDAYERSLSLVQLLLAWLRSSCPDVQALLAQAARGDAIFADAGGLRPDHAGPGTGGGSAAPDVSAGLRLDLIAAAACAMRYRELTAAGAAARRLDAVMRARDQGAAWVVVEETGDQARAPYLPYQRVEAHVPTGRAVIISIEPDETLVNAVWRLDEADIDLASGRLIPGPEIGSYASAAELNEALASARPRLG
jgi:hypothetical protein